MTEGNARVMYGNVIDEIRIDEQRPRFERGSLSHSPLGKTGWISVQDLSITEDGQIEIAVSLDVQIKQGGRVNYGSLVDYENKRIISVKVPDPFDVEPDYTVTFDVPLFIQFADKWVNGGGGR